jgi:hypothetical protein
MLPRRPENYRAPQEISHWATSLSRSAAGVACARRSSIPAKVGPGCSRRSPQIKSSRNSTAGTGSSPYPHLSPNASRSEPEMTMPPRTLIRPPGITTEMYRAGRFGAVVDAQVLNQKRTDDLVDREPEIAAKLEACCPEAPCGLLIYADSSGAARLPSRLTAAPTAGQFHIEHAPSPHDHTPGDGEQPGKPRDDRPRAARVLEAAHQISASRSATAGMDAASGPSYGTAQRPSARQHSRQYRRGPQRCRARACTREFRSRANATGHRCGFESGAQRMTVPPRSSDRTSRAIAKRGGPPQLETLAEAEARNLVRIPTQSGHRFRFEAGHRSDLKPATIPK